jgi:plasmid maintenance system antidote protein VapI
MRSILEFTDYRAFLRAWVAERPAQRTQRNLARRLGVAASFVSRVMNGKRALSPDEQGTGSG